MLSILVPLLCSQKYNRRKISKNKISAKQIIKGAFPFWKIQDEILKFKNGFPISLLNRSIQWSIKGTGESTLGEDSLGPLIHHDPSGWNLSV